MDVSSLYTNIPHADGVPRGYSGTAILHRENWNIKTDKLDDGCDRIVVLRLVAQPNVCVINTYLPCRGNHSRESFQNTISKLEEIVEKFKSNHAIFLCGDLNASLTRDPPNERDLLLRQFVENNSLINQQNGSPTFYHASGESHVEIDYILKNPMAAAVSDMTHVENPSPLKVSDHVAVSTLINISAADSDTRILYYPRPRWDRCDRYTYMQSIHIQTSRYDKNHIKSQDSFPDFIKTTLHEAAKSSIPNHRPNEPKQRKIRAKVCSKEISEAARSSKKAYAEWKDAGSPTDRAHPLQENVKRAKRQLRSAQRKTAARQRQDTLDKIMVAKTNDDKMFYRLVNLQRSTNQNNINCLYVDGEKLTDDEDLVAGWAKHFQSLATPVDNDNYEDDFLNEAKANTEIIHMMLESSAETIKPTDIDEVTSAISRMNNNKAADILGLTAEHFKMASEEFKRLLVDFNNIIFDQKKITSQLKRGMITPVHKKGDQQNPGNYRGITVTPIILKILEHILSGRHDIKLALTQSRLQSGFTKGTSSLMSALLITECQLEAKANKKKLILTTLDTRKAFDVVDHTLLLQNLYLDGIQTPEWLLLQDLYDGMTSVAKWKDKTSEDIHIRQCVRQGGVLSTQHYKRYNNPLLLDLEEHFEGAKIGPISIPHTTCADDIALLTHHTKEMELMLSRVERYSKKYRYDINPTKSAAVISNATSGDEPPVFTLNGESIPEETSTVHLGLTRNQKCTTDTTAKINTGRKTAYSLLGAGLHGKSGMKQDIKGHIWQTFVTPRLIYGLEVLHFTASDIKKIENFQTKAIKQIQHLPDKTANSASLALLGILPIEDVVNRNCLNLLYRLLQNTNSIEYAVAVRQLATKTIDDKSMFSKFRKLLLQYSLPSVYELIRETPTKEKWKKMVNEAINSTVLLRWKVDIQEKSSLKYLNSDSIKAGKAHHMYTSVRSNRQDIQRAEIKAKLLTGAYNLQANRAVFNQFEVDPTCKLCNTEPEDREHFLASCPYSTLYRTKYKERIVNILRKYSGADVDDIVGNRRLFTQAVLDCTHPHILGTQLSEEEVSSIELISREYIMKIHLSRCRQLANLAIHTE